MLGQIRQTLLRFLAFDRIQNRTRKKLRSTIPLDQVILRTVLQGLQRQRMVIVSAEDDDRHVGTRGQHLGDRAETMGVGKREIKKDSVEPATTQLGEPIRQHGGMGDLKLIEGPLGQKILRELGIDRVVFDQQQFDHEAVPIPRQNANTVVLQGVTQGSVARGVIRMQRQVVIVGGGCLAGTWDGCSGCALHLGGD